MNYFLDLLTNLTVLALFSIVVSVAIAIVLLFLLVEFCGFVFSWFLEVLDYDYEDYDNYDSNCEVYEDEIDKEEEEL